MQIFEKRLTDIHPYEKNPRKNDDAVRYVANSIKEFGFKVPIVIDKNGVIVAGHTRYKAAEQLGLETVPCVIADDLSDKQIKAFRLADNKTAEIAEWDFDFLNDELDDIDDLDMSDFGFTDDFDALEIEKESKTEASAAVQAQYLKFGDKEVPITDEEIEMLTEKLNSYARQYGTIYGFVRWLLNELL